MERILILVDLQRDFCPGGSLAVEGGDAIIPAVNALVARGGFDLVIATQDWHPEGHVSFASAHGKAPFEKIALSYGEQALWPDHCVQGSPGAEFHPGLDGRGIHFIVRKGFRKGIDSYSAFFENDRSTDTRLAGLIERDREIAIAGIATDFCVLYTALDAREKLGCERVVLVEDACAAVSPEGGREAVERMRSAGVRIARAAEYLGGKP